MLSFKSLVLLAGSLSGAMALAGDRVTVPTGVVCEGRTFFLSIQADPEAQTLDFEMTGDPGTLVSYEAHIGPGHAGQTPKVSIFDFTDSGQEKNQWLDFMGHYEQVKFFPASTVCTPTRVPGQCLTRNIPAHYGPVMIPNSWINVQFQNLGHGNYKLSMVDAKGLGISTIKPLGENVMCRLTTAP